MISRTQCILAALCALPLLPTEARAEPLPPELNLIPRDAGLFVSFRVSELWNEPRLKPLRDYLIEDGSMLRNFEKEMGFRPDDVERVSLVCANFHPRQVLSTPLVVVTFKKPYDLASVLDNLGGMNEADYRRFMEQRWNPGGGGGFPINPPRIKIGPPPKFIDDRADDPPPPPRGKEKDLPKEPIKEEKPDFSDCNQKVDPEERPVKKAPLDLKAPYFMLARNDGFLVPINERTLIIGNLYGGARVRAVDQFGRVLRDDAEISELHNLLATLLKRSDKGPLTPALEAAAGKHSVVLGVNIPAVKEAIPEKGWVHALPIDSLLKCRCVTATLDFKEEVRLALHVDGPDAATAQRVLDVVRSIHILGMESLPGVMKLLDDDDSPARVLLSLIEPILRAAKFELKGTTASVVMSAKVDDQFAKTIRESIEKVREAATLARAQNNLKQFGIAIHNYASANNGDQLPFPGMRDANGKVLLSWRVAILPYIEQAPLYLQFKFDEPWDSAHNKKLIDKMPKIFAPLGGAAAPAGHTFYRTFIGGGAIGDGRFNIGNITDGTMNTIFVAEAGEAVIWTKPDEVLFDPKKPLPKLGGHFKGKMNVLMGDGSVYTLDLTKLSERTLKLAIQADDGLPLPADFHRR
jgi:Protein of unknown function (DUF1559)